MYNKIRRIIHKIHDSNRRIITLEENQKELLKLDRENYWANVFQSSVAGSSWFKEIPLNVGRWAGNYSLFYVLYRILNEIKPQNILELGLGETTKMIQAYKKDNNSNANCITVEQNKDWIDIRIKNDISIDLINLLHIPVHTINIDGKQTSAYKGLVDALKPFDQKFNLILIDGPNGSLNFSRYNIIELVTEGFLASDFIIIVDDYERNGERQTIEKLLELLQQKNIKFEVGDYVGEKHQRLIVSPNFHYLISL